MSTGVRPITDQRNRAVLNTGSSSRCDKWLLAAILVVAAFNYLWQLGSSSFFVDEVLSVEDATTSISRLISNIPNGEKTPWTYFIFLHEWLGRTGSQSEWVARLPSAVAGVALVGAVYWLARVLTDRRVALLAAALCALSPLVLEYAQEARVYAFLLLSVTLAVALTVRGTDPSVAPRRRTLLLALGVAMSILSIWLHYTGALVVLPLCVLVAVQGSLSPRSRTAFIAACAVGVLLLVPLAAERHNNPSGGIGAAAGVNWGSLLEVAETPFDTRAQSEFDPRSLGVGILDIAGVTIMLGSVFLLLRTSRAAVPNRRLLLSLALCPPSLLVLAGLAGQDDVNKRYAAVAVPFMLTIVAAAAATRRRRAAVGLGAVALAVCAIGSVQTHRQAGFYSPAREAIDSIRAHWRPDQPILVPAEISSDGPLAYYARRELSPLPEVIPVSSVSGIAAVLRRRRPTWVIGNLGHHLVNLRALEANVDRQLRPYGYRAARTRTFTTAATFMVVLARPR